MAKKEKRNTGLKDGLKLRNGIYHFRFQWDGVLHTGSCRTTELRVAQQYLLKLKSELLLNGVDIRANRQLSFQDAFDLYLKVKGPKLTKKTIGDIKSNFKLHWSSFAKTPIKDMQDKIDELYNTLANVKGIAPGTQVNQFKRIRGIIELARKRGLHNVFFEFPNIVVAHDPKQTPDEEEIQNFFVHVDKLGSIKQQILIKSLYYMGLRISEALRLSWDNYNEVDKTYRIDEKQKNRQVIYQPLPEEMIKCISLLERKPGELICPNNSGTEHSFMYTDFLMKKISKLMGLKSPITHHKLRSSFCTILLRKGVSLAVVSKLARHASSSTTLKHYVKFNMADMRQGLMAIEKPLQEITEIPAE